MNINLVPEGVVQKEFDESKTFVDKVYKDLGVIVEHLEETPPDQRDTLRYHRIIFYVRQLADSLRTGEGGPVTTSLSPLERRLVAISSTLTNLPKKE